MSDVGGALNVSNITLTFDDEATSSLPDNDELVDGTFKPTQGTSGTSIGENPVPANFPSPAPSGPYGTDLSVFDGTNPNGTWELYALDDSALAAGKVAGGWSLEISTSDTTPPKVMSTSPANGATLIAPGVNVTATFTEAMDASTTDGDASTINGTTFKLVRLNADGTTTRVRAAVRYVATTKKAILDPASNLGSGRTYKATVTSGAQDLAGNPLDQNPNIAGNQPKSWKFKVQ